MAARLYALGSNSSGQLGVGHYDDVDVPTPCQFIPAPTPYARLADNDTSETVTFKKTYNLKSQIRKIVSGGNHTIMLCDNGAVYAAGNREALGEVVDLGTQYPELDAPSRQGLAPYFKRVMWWEGSVLVCIFTDISATWSASFFVVAPQLRDSYVVRFGEIYACGKGEKGELGLGKDIVETAKPRRVALFGSGSYPSITGLEPDQMPLIPGILAGIWSTVAYTVTCSTDDIHVFGWGSCRKGQLGDSVIKETVLWRPRKVAEEDIKQKMDIDRVFMAAAGRDFTLLFGGYGTQGNRTRQWRLLGRNRFLKGYEDDVVKDFLADLAITGRSADMPLQRAYPFASWSNIYVLELPAQKVKALGRNDHGQLPPENLPALQTMAAGSEHCVGLTLEGSVVTWGWGEHGNCGRIGDGTGQGWSVLYLSVGGMEKITGVGAGCATTFFWTAVR